MLSPCAMHCNGTSRREWVSQYPSYARTQSFQETRYRSRRWRRAMTRPVRFLAALAVTLAVAPAAADIPPPNACTSDSELGFFMPWAVGTPCNKALCSDNVDASYGSGICQSATCDHVGPTDGGIGIIPSTCTLCLAPDGGQFVACGDAGVDAGLSPSSGVSPGDASTSTGVDARGSSSSAGGCAMVARRAQTIAPFALMAAGALLVSGWRRRRNRR